MLLDVIQAIAHVRLTGDPKIVSTANGKWAINLNAADSEFIDIALKRPFREDSVTIFKLRLDNSDIEIHNSRIKIEGIYLLKEAQEARSHDYYNFPSVRDIFETVVDLGIKWYDKEFTIALVDLTVKEDPRVQDHFKLTGETRYETIMRAVKRNGWQMSANNNDLKVEEGDFVEWRLAFTQWVKNIDRYQSKFNRHLDPRWTWSKTTHEGGVPTGVMETKPNIHMDVWLKY